MTSVQTLYQIREAVKIDRRPKRSATKPKTIVPRNRPMKKAATKLAMPLLPKKPAVVAGGDVAGQEEVVVFEASAERKQHHHHPDPAGRGQAIEPGRNGSGSRHGVSLPGRPDSGLRDVTMRAVVPPAALRQRRSAS
jgi:hypothetical protein